MLNIGGLKEGIVLDHIEAGKSLEIYYNLGLDKLDCQVAIIKNAKSNKMGKKDIIKIEGGMDHIDLEILGYIDHNITVNIIRDNEIVEKKSLSFQKRSLISYSAKIHAASLPSSRASPCFHLSDAEKETYRCMYCEEKYSR